MCRREVTVLGVAALIASVATLAVAQTPAGSISGVVINGMSGEPIRGALVAIPATEESTTTDLGGSFRLTAPTGTLEVRVSAEGFQQQMVTDVTVTAGSNTDFSVVLLPAAGTAEEAAAEETFGSEITVTAAADESTAAALLTERRNAAQISDAIGAEEMSRTTGSDAADAVKRVTGISVQDDKYVFVRGLGERYSNTSLNGSRIPSTEFEKRVVPFDLFPAGLLEKIRVSKSYTVDKPGDFAAGFVEMETLDFPVEEQASIGFSTGYHSIATGDEFARYGDGLDVWGDGGQPLPDALPDVKLIRRSPVTGEGFTPEELEAFGELFAGTWRGRAGEVGSPWGGRSYDAPVDRSVKAAYGNTFGRFGLVVSGSYDSDYRARTEERNFYRISEIEPDGIAPLHAFDIDSNTEQIRQGIVANLAYRLSDDHHLKLRSMFNTLAESQANHQEGFFSDLASNIREYEVDYTTQDVRTVQLTGEHFVDLGPLGSLLEWRGSTSTASTEQDMRFSLYQEKDGEFLLTDNSSSGFVFANELEDTVDDIGVDWTTFLSGDEAFGSVKVGLASTLSDREFGGRRLRFKHRSTAGIDLSLPPEELFSPGLIGPGGFEIEETTRPTDSYLADQTVDAAYGQLDWQYDRWRFIGGVRVESSDIEVVSRDIFDADREPVLVRLDDTDWLPSLSVVYALTGGQNVRLSASQTVNRPEFRELAPFKFSDSVGFFERRGNPDLVSATIRSYDARWEWFPSAEDVVAVSAFYKRFDDPIESVIVEAVTRAETWINAEEASNQGIELELRRNLNPGALHNFSAIVNYAYIDSEIQVPEGGIQTNPNRAMVGQPDHVGNAAVEWQQIDWASAVRLLVNHTGERVALAGAYGLPDVLEEPRTTLDLLYRQGLDLFGLPMSVKLSASNLTEEEWEFTQGGRVYQSWQPGTTYGLSVGFTLF